MTRISGERFLMIYIFLDLLQIWKPYICLLKTYQLHDYINRKTQA